MGHFRISGVIDDVYETGFNFLIVNGGHGDLGLRLLYGAIRANDVLNAHFTRRQSSISLEPIVVALGNFVVSRSHLLFDVGFEFGAISIIVLR